MIKKIFFALILALAALTATAPVEAKQKTTKKTTTTTKTTKKTSGNTTTRGSGEVRKEKQKTEKEIAETKKKINENEQKISGQLDRLSDIDSQIERQMATIDELTGTIEQLALRIDSLTDSISALQLQDSILSEQLAVTLRHRHVRNSRLSDLSFLTSSTSLREARQRFNYTSMLQRAQNNRIVQLRDSRAALERTRAELDSVQANHAAAVKQLSTANDVLNARRDESEKIVKNLKNEKQSLNRILNEKNKKMALLAAELDRIIALEAKKKNTSSGKNNSSSQTKTQKGQSGNADATRNLSGSFSANKGKLLFPVAGKYSIVGTFGRSKHNELSNMQIDNSGIDISVAKGTKARSVYEGTVSSIFFLDGYENVVIVRHGEYLTVYAGIASINVTKGDKLKTGQNIGTIATQGGQTVLHFEVRKEKNKLNPLQWVK